MPLITFEPSGISVEAEEGSLLLDAVKNAGLSIEAPCGGHGICHKCLVKVLSGEVSFDNRTALSKELLSEGFVLACRTKITGNAYIQVIAPSEAEQGKFSYIFDDMNLIDHTLLPSHNDFSPLTEKMTLKLPPPETGDGLSDLDRLKRTMLSKPGIHDISIPLDILKTLPLKVRACGGKIEAYCYNKSGMTHIVRLDAEQTGSLDYGISVDIGTTTVAVSLACMKDGHILSSKTDYNGQIECGLDVISRINYAKKPEHLKELQRRVIRTINDLLGILAKNSHIDKNMILNASIAGNTTMMHLLLGIVPEYIRLDPYTPAVYDIPAFKASHFGLDIAPEAAVYFAPCVGSYLGGDITSGLLCTALSTDSRDISLFIDIGTNGEIVLGNSEFLLGCACSAGPAFEGGGIEKGMRASKGAIEYVEISKESGAVKYNTIGNAPPAGICGSGMISLIAGLFSSGWMDAAGKLDRSRPCPSIPDKGKNARYLLLDPSTTKLSDQIYITEADIDNFIRAKGAIFSACQVLLKKIPLNLEDISVIYIAGGFGRYLNIADSITIGLLPDIDEKKFRFIGNASLMGSYMTLMSQKHRKNQSRLSRNITYIDLSSEPEYMNEYTAALFLPHTDRKLFPNAAL